MRLLLAIQDSMGHLLPSIRFGQLVQALGHGVVAVSADRHGALLDQSGIEHIPVRNADGPFMSMTDWYNVETVKVQVRVLDSLVEQVQPDAVVCGPLAISAMIFAERHSLPVGVLGYSTYLYPGLDETAEGRSWRLRSITGFYNSARAALGMAPVAADPESSPLIGDCHLLRNVPEFTGPARLPESVLHVGALHGEPGAGHFAAREFARHWRARGRRIVFVQIGRLFGEGDLWRRLTIALDRLGLAAIADTGRADYLRESADQPAHCFATRFASIGDVVDLVDAVICSGHGASLLGAMTHRKPIACLPTTADTVELADRAAACGLGVSIDSSLDSDALQTRLREFLDRHAAGAFDQSLERYCASLGRWKSREPEVVAAMLERLMEIRRARAPAHAELSA
ncbi:MAG: hypothetical protein WBR13_14110 [Allosphingosinicella sp.]